MSLIAKKEVFDEGLEIKNYIDDHRSNMSPKVKENPETKKITEENEDENSDGSLNTDMLPRKSAISDNTFKSNATPNQGGNYFTSNNSEATMIQNNSQRLDNPTVNSMQESNSKNSKT
jgi:hypothetical protein